MRKQLLSSIIIGLLHSTSLPAANDDIERAVWANEAIVATYTFDYKNYLLRQRAIASYFSASGWIAYSNALQASHLPDDVMKNSYEVSAVATLPPEIKPLSNGHWQAVMPLLVVYKNPQYQQKQYLSVTINFSQASQGVGVRGLAIDSLQSVVTTPPCVCPPALFPPVAPVAPAAPAVKH